MKKINTAWRERHRCATLYEIVMEVSDEAET